METPNFVFQFWMRRPTAFFYTLPPLDRQSLLTAEFQVLLECGGKDLYAEYVRAASHPWWQFGANRFANFGQLIEYQQRMEAANWSQHMETVSYLGTEVMPTLYDIPPAQGGVQPIFKGFLAKTTPAFIALSEDQRTSLMEQVDKRLDSAQGKRLVFCDIGWSSERWQAFGIEYFPNIECVQDYGKMLSELNLSNYVESDVLLGTMQ
jgi:hypothetical protein